MYLASRTEERNDPPLGMDLALGWEVVRQLMQQENNQSPVKKWQINREERREQGLNYHTYRNRVVMSWPDTQNSPTQPHLTHHSEQYKWIFFTLVIIIIHTYMHACIHTYTHKNLKSIILVPLESLFQLEVYSSIKNTKENHQ